jgi:hypothetical protein
MGKNKEYLYLALYLFSDPSIGGLRFLLSESYVSIAKYEREPGMISGLKPLIFKA